MDALCSDLGQDQLRFLGRPIEQSHVADALNEGGVEAARNSLQYPVAFLTVADPDASLDELVMAQRTVEFRDHGISQSAAANRDDRLEVVSQAAQMLALVFA